MMKDLECVLDTKEEIDARVKELGEQISRDYAGKDPVFVGILKGSFIFMADLVRAVSIPCSMDFMSVSSYGSGTQTTGAVKIIKDLSRDIEGKDVIMVEDILDTGITLNYLMGYLGNRRPASLRIVTLLNKEARRHKDIHLDVAYTGFHIPDGFVVGYGLDYAEEYRNLPCIGILSSSVYAPDGAEKKE